MNVALVCGASVEELLLTTGAVYLARPEHDAAAIRLVLRDACQPALGEALIETPPCTSEEELAFAKRVWTGFEHATAGKGAPKSNTNLRHFAYACATEDETMPEIVHRYLRLGFREGPSIYANITNAHVEQFLSLVRRTSNECEKTRQFARFTQQTDGSFVAALSPAANTIPLVASYFAARMRPERFVLIDKKRRIVAFHERNRARCALAAVEQSFIEELTASKHTSSEEQYIQAMWKHFYDAMELEGRRKEQRGYDLRVSWMPKRLWADLPELSALSDDPGTFVPKRYASSRDSDTSKLSAPISNASLSKLGSPERRHAID
ncbi:TIGR03915 family putative DNA repair protein [Olsenella sp. Marseille-QA0557]|uniref:TIGR03915 family putative DNA repair protein n=1 Tax=Olsenella sp. Marseille-QA0557 TaxID=3378782 RepID=UPI003D0D208A